MERGPDRVRATTMPRVTAENPKKMITSNVDADAFLMTDEYRPTRASAMRTIRA